MFQFISGSFLFVIIIAVFFLMSAIKILNEYERGVIFRLGRALPHAKGPGLILLIPMVDRLTKVNLQLVTYDVPSQDIITRDNVTMKVNAVVYFRVIDPLKAIIEVRDYWNATQLLAQTTLRSVCGQVELDDLLAEREKVNARLAEILDNQTEPWGIKVTLVEIRAIDLPIEMQRAMAKQAEAERERRGKVINAEGEFQAAAKMAEAAHVLAAEPMSLKLRYLQTLREIAAEKNSTTLFPIPIDLITPFMKMAKRMEKLEEWRRKKIAGAVAGGWRSSGGPGWLFGVEKSVQYR